MKKLFYSSIISFFLFSTACKNHDLPFVWQGVKAVSKCCTAVQSKNKVQVAINTVSEESKASQIIAPLPAYTWDSKMMFY